jgi:hypothetical protein
MLLPALDGEDESIEVREAVGCPGSHRILPLAQSGQSAAHPRRIHRLQTGCLDHEVSLSVMRVHRS